ncbi:MAG: hypothetical protein U9O98_00120 [Asgard group archaeon]|nr:hypothetical protein [Asgard group archaeon]
MAKRIISLDIIRGWAILGNLLVHFFMITSEVEGLAEAGQLDQLGITGFLFMGFIVVFGHWRGLFLLISATVHWYSMQKKYKAGVSRNTILRQELLKGFLLFIWAMLFYLFIGEFALSNQWANLQTTVSVDWRQIYHVDQFTNIAIAIFISAIIFYFWSAKEQTRKPWIAVSSFIVLGLLFVFPAPYVHEAANNYWGVDFSTNGGIDITSFKGPRDYVIRFIVNQFVARESPLMPHYAYSAAGSVIGVFISQKEKLPKKKFLGWGFGTAGISIVFGGLWLIVVDKVFTLPVDEIITLTANFHIHPTWYVFATLGLLLIVIMSFFASIEFNETLHIKRRLKMSRMSRRAGFLSLSVYSLATIQAFLRVGMWGIFKAFGNPNADMFRTNLGLPTGWVVFMWALELGTWFLILWLWEKGPYIGSPDWLFAAVLKGPMKMKPNKRWLFQDPLDVQGRLINVQPILWVDHKPSKEDIVVTEKQEDSLEIQEKHLSQAK